MPSELNEMYKYIKTIISWIRNVWAHKHGTSLKKNHRPKREQLLALALRLKIESLSGNTIGIRCEEELLLKSYANFYYLGLNHRYVTMSGSFLKIYIVLLRAH